MTETISDQNSASDFQVFSGNSSNTQSTFVELESEIKDTAISRKID